MGNLFCGIIIATLLVGLNACISTAKPAPTWSEFWRQHGVDSPPPPDFLEGKYSGKILNLTGGKLSDAVARAWILADLRRSRGDDWATSHLRLDLANANVFGPPGLNGSGEGIEQLLARGAVRVDGHGGEEIVAAAVISVADHLPANNPADDSGEFGKFVIVLMYRPNPIDGVFADGHTERLRPQALPGELHWQLDTGSFREDPTVGPLWYQAQGWSCAPEDGSTAGMFCALVEP
jgi:hypothetical protein